MVASSSLRRLVCMIVCISNESFGCWDERHTEAICCDLEKGPEGKTECWSGGYTFKSCCSNTVGNPATSVIAGVMRSASETEVAAIGAPDLLGKDCWDAKHTASLCCDRKFGPQGNAKCWSEVYTFALCCKSCWDGRHKEDTCCNLQHGPRGNESCWSGAFTYEACCTELPKSPPMAKTKQEEQIRLFHGLVPHLRHFDVQGDFVEIGVDTGNTAVTLAEALRELLEQTGEERRLWLYDIWSSSAFPTAPSAQDEEGALQAWEHCNRHPTKCRPEHSTSKAVRARLSTTKLPLDNVVIREGNFSETLKPNDAIKPSWIALLHIDSGWYDPTLLALEALYDRLSPGGVVVLASFGRQAGMRKAFFDFAYRFGLTPNLERTGHGIAWFSKETSSLTRRSLTV
eukprot:TRINITY_DN31888_c0_g1_i1.p1 TRINITY_DN31888_c0_g1~~TRINITY_DN31888_c0_g1_i1.p1  ORF type:complete len:400 (+),score=56.91 TRINITY_DN31888_c0_g1_i1:32-1231(+)